MWLNMQRQKPLFLKHDRAYKILLVRFKWILLSIQVVYIMPALTKENLIVKGKETKNKIQHPKYLLLKNYLLYNCLK